MAPSIDLDISPELDLVLDRVVPLAPHLVWRAWTEPELLMQWFCPRPWTTVKCVMDLRPGGLFHTTMESPEGEAFPGDGCILEAVEKQKLVWTSAMDPGFRPKPPAVPFEGGIESFFFTCVLLLEEVDGGTRYRAIAMHSDPEARKRHEEMGFHQGWGAALDQLVELMQGQA